MKQLSRMILIPALMVGLLGPMATAKAQDKPVAIISISSLDELLGDVKFLAEQGGAAGGGQLLEGMITPFVQGLDRTRPIGATVSMAGGQPQAVIFIPVKDFQQLLGTVEAQLGKAQDAGNGVKQLNGPVPIFVKEQNGWAFLSQSANGLAQLPADPGKLLAGLDKKYDIAVQGHLQNLPKPMRDMAIQAIQDGARQGLQRQPNESDEQFELRKALMKAQMAQVKEMFDTLDQTTLGFAIDRKVKQVYLDISVTGTSGSRLARQAAGLANTTSKFAGFLMPNAAMTMNMATKVGEQDIAQIDNFMKLARQQALKEIEKDGSIPANVKENVKSIVGDVIAVVTDTFKEGKLDGGAVVVLENKTIKFAAGGLLADGKKLEAAFKKLVDLASQEPDFPKVTLNASKHAGVDFHTITVPVPDQEAQQFLGSNVEVVVGMGAKSAYLAFGKDSLTLVKQIIDQSASRATDQVPPVQVNFALGSIMDFSSTIEDNQVLTMLSGMLKQAKGKDHVRITASAIPNGVTYRLQVEEGIIKLLGAGAQLGGRGGF